MTPFITFRDKDKKGDLQYYVLQREHPHYVGMISGSPTINFVPASPIPGYNLFVVFSGCLNGNVLPSYTNVVDELTLVMETMCAWYYTDRIIMDKKRYEKFRIKSDVTVPAK